MVGAYALRRFCIASRSGCSVQIPDAMMSVAASARSKAGKISSSLTSAAEARSRF
jgi:hypothetical protein